MSSGLELYVLRLINVDLLQISTKYFPPALTVGVSQNSSRLMWVFHAHCLRLFTGADLSNQQVTFWCTQFFVKNFFQDTSQEFSLLHALSPVQWISKGLCPTISISVSVYKQWSPHTIFSHVVTLIWFLEQVSPVQASMFCSHCQPRMTVTIETHSFIPVFQNLSSLELKGQ